MLQTSLVSQLAVNARTFPQRPALEVVGGQSLTYEQAWRRVVGLAATLEDVPERNGIRPVALLLPNGIDAALTYLACQLAGCVGVPLNSRLALAEMEYILEDSLAAVIMTSAPFLERAEALGASRPLRIVDCAAVATPDSASDEVPAVDGDSPFVIGYTSGTTGLPKGGIYSGDHMLLNYLSWARSYEISDRTTLLTPGPMFHLSYAGLTMTALMVGARTRIMVEFDPVTACDEVAQRATLAFLVPTMAAAIIGQARAEGRTSLDSLRFILSSGAPISADLLREELEFFPNAVIAEAYGWSEGGWVTFERKVPETLVPQCVGWPVIGVDLRILREDRTECEVDEPGEIAVRNLLPFRGYLNKPDRTRDAIWNGFVLSGDIGVRIADGRILVVDRKKDMIVTGGENVYSAEVERVLSDHPDVVEVAVIGRPDQRWGEAVTAVVVPASPGADAAELRAFCRERLAGYKVPKSIEFIDQLPRNAMGKVQKFVLRDSAAAAPVGAG